jgi:hypothetical protein
LQEIVDHLFVNSSRSSRLTFNFNITFPDVACSLLSADSGDPLSTHDDIDGHVFKTRLDQHGNPISDKTKHEVRHILTVPC